LSAERSTPSAAGVVLARSTAGSVPEDDSWLSPGEAAVHTRLRVSKRVADWRLGRWVAKEAILRALAAPELPRAALEILASSGGAPQVRVLAPGVWPRLALSISHAAGTGFAAVARGDARLGCDVEEIAPRSPEFVSDYFTADESAWIRAGGQERHVRANLVWSAKESALKALGEGLRKDTRSVAVEVGGAEGPAVEGWRPLKVVAPAEQVFAGWWLLVGDFAWTVVTDACIEVEGLR